MMPSLRNYLFPGCALETLRRLLTSGFKNKNSSKNLITNYVFMDKYGPKLNESQENQLALLLVEFFEITQLSESMRNSLFLLLFYENLTTQRIGIVIRIVDISIATASAPILAAIGVWMQQIGCNNCPCLMVANKLISTYVPFSSKLQEIKKLQAFEPRFACNFMISATEIYFNESFGAILIPPDKLSIIFAEWITENPNFCLTTLNPLILPTDIIAMPPKTPLAGLIRWTVLAAVYIDKINYHNLHGAILKSMENNNNVLKTRDLSKTVTTLKKFCECLEKCNVSPTEDASYKKSIKRLVLVLSLIFSNNCIKGNVKKFLGDLEALPPTERLTLFINNNKHKFQDMEK